MHVLGIESSCDETSAAVISDGRLRSNIVSSQIDHRRFGGVVPELASRMHLRLIVPVVEEALSVAGVGRGDLGGVAVTSGPGLMGSLMVGVNFAKSFAYALGIPCVGINHMEGHIYANFLEDPKPAYPFICLTVSGGHTQLVLVREVFRHEILGETLDDAAGEAFDKVAKMLGLPFPGGPAIERLAREGNPSFVAFPRSMAGDGTLNFSFSGVKTAVLYWLRDHPGLATDPDGPGGRKLLADLCASFQAAVVEVLVMKTLAARERFGVSDVAVAGGVSANGELRHKLTAAASRCGFTLHVPPLEFCTDNAAMIALIGYKKLLAGAASPYGLQADPNMVMTS
ncbi:MAG TPA: tRNA (adenosine(37)-N6)-threonylcarbamoyltransferase complex transferase subunit TsaD [Bacteroidota bacterium]|nr:tRNA (adenosine(37)-N6)-threonylcarbamoyltransferase complex transferase subunit TsaD [Bacteroidota bacterium]